MANLAALATAGVGVWKKNFPERHAAQRKPLVYIIGTMVTASMCSRQVRGSCSYENEWPAHVASDSAKQECI